MMFRLFKEKPVTTAATTVAVVAGRCASCVHFCNDPAFLERNIPGMASMSSAHASVRSDDGICDRHDRYLSARASCAQYQQRPAEAATTCHMAAVGQRS